MLNELLLNLIGRDEPVPELFDVYQVLAGAVARSVQSQVSLLRDFELNLLDHPRRVARSWIMRPDNGRSDTCRTVCIMCDPKLA
jgi:hypothetical protein